MATATLSFSSRTEAGHGSAVDESRLDDEALKLKGNKKDRVNEIAEGCTWRADYNNAAEEFPQRSRDFSIGNGNTNIGKVTYCAPSSSRRTIKRCMRQERGFQRRQTRIL
jgi:hypothetical protein